MTHSFPTRRASDLFECAARDWRILFAADRPAGDRAARTASARPIEGPRHRRRRIGVSPPHVPRRRRDRDAGYRGLDRKSTRSELQSLMRISYAVFCLKKKTKHKEEKID